MKQTLSDAISGKKKPPAVNAKEEPGVGPELEPENPKVKEKPAALRLSDRPRVRGDPRSDGRRAAGDPGDVVPLRFRRLETLAVADLGYLHDQHDLLAALVAVVVVSSGVVEQQGSPTGCSQ